MKRTGNDKKSYKTFIGNISLDTVENILGKIYEKEHVEYLLYRVFEYRKNEKQLIGFPYLFQCKFQLSERVVFFHGRYPLGQFDLMALQTPIFRRYFE